MSEHVEHDCVPAVEYERVLVDRDRYRAALARIADAESGRWGWIAHDALHPERAPHDAHGTG